MIKTLRLITTWDCNRSCKGCCNKQPRYSPLNIDCYFSAEKNDYKEIILTGGEPLLFQDELIDLIQTIRFSSPPSTKIYIYTAYLENPILLTFFLSIVDGITLTLHEQKDVKKFYDFNTFIFMSPSLQKKSLRLNVFRPVTYSEVQTPFWKVRDNIEWIDDCPLPGNEVIKQLINPWKFKK